MARGGTPSNPPTTEDSGALVAAGRQGAPTTSFVSRLARNLTDQVDSDSTAPLPSGIPALSLAIVTCMDTRIDLESRLGITIGDAHILRNAGGRVSPDVIRSLHLSANLMKVREIGILHHTNCGLGGTDNDTLARRTGVDSIDFLPFQSPRESVRADVTAVLQAEILPVGGIVWGAVYHLGANRISVVRGPIAVTRPRHREPGVSESTSRARPDGRL
jgi:carbonic anhydrase